MPGISDEQVAASYPVFYGQIVVSKDVDAKEPDGKNYTKFGVKPYGDADGNELTPPGQTGIYWATYFWKPEDITNPNRDIHNLILGLRAMKVPNGGDTTQAVGFEGWFKMRPPRNGYSNPFLPCAAPRKNGKSVPVPPRPEDWDLQTWLDEHAQDDESSEADGSNAAAIDVTDPETAEIFKAACLGKSRSTALKNLLASPLSRYGVGDIQTAINTLFVLTDDKYAMQEAA